jgi:hypothetical protein
MPVISTTQEDLQFKRSSGKVRETLPHKQNTNEKGLEHSSSGIVLAL